MSQLVSLMPFGIVGGSVLPHAPEDLQPFLAQTPQGAGVALAFGPVSLVVGLRPGTSASAQIGPQMHGRPQEAIAGLSQARLPDLPALEADRRGAKMALQALGSRKLPAVAPQAGQQPGSQFFPGTRQRTKQIMIRVPGEQGGNALAEVLQLSLQSLQQTRQGAGGQALGGGDRRRAGEPGGGGKDFQPPLTGLGAPQLVRVQELFPAPPAGGLQCLRCGKGQHKRPGGWRGPVLKRLQGRRIILPQGGLELTYQG